MIAAIAGYLVATRDDDGGAECGRRRQRRRVRRSQLVGATDFDPEGDGEESAGEVGILIDDQHGHVLGDRGLQGTTATFGGAKAGVGLVLDARRHAEVAAR